MLHERGRHCQARVEEERQRIILEGDVPSPVNPPSGCYFHPRCPYAKDICKTDKPEFRDLGGGKDLYTRVSVLP